MEKLQWPLRGCSDESYLSFTNLGVNNDSLSLDAGHTTFSLEFLPQIAATPVHFVTVLYHIPNIFEFFQSIPRDSEKFIYSSSVHGKYETTS